MMVDVTIIGGGIIGVCAAITLQDDGLSVEIIDRGLPTQAASYGNCGLLAAGEIVPVAKPGVMTKIPKWLLDPRGPLFVRSEDFVRQVPWLLRFLAVSREKKVLEIASALAPMTRRAQSDYAELLSRTDLTEAIVPAENLMVFNSRSDFEADTLTWDIRRRHGFEHVTLSCAEVRDMEPAIGGPIGFGVLLKNWLQFANPGKLRDDLMQVFKSRGGAVIAGSVNRLDLHAGRVSGLYLEDGERKPVKEVVLAAGAWCRPLLDTAGIKLPLAALHGYHAHVEDAGVTLNRAVIYANGGFVVSPMSSGLRIGGTIELARLDAKPNFARAKIIAEGAKRILPELNVANPSYWMGPRPFMPDTLPVIGRAPAAENLVLAVGHGQLGMTLAATTARLVRAVVKGEKSEMELWPFRPDRF
jgi:D-amino-acid dehydrogenase